jgi:predicted negative regulator of RcsB-dependent stress response
MSQNLPVILIEVVLIFGGVLAFGWWQLRNLSKERQRREAAEPHQSTGDGMDTSHPLNLRAGGAEPEYEYR